MQKRHFLAAAAAAAGALPLTSGAAAPASSARRPVLLTVGGVVGKGNRGPMDKALDQMMGKHGIQFSEAYALDATALRGMPQVTIQPTLEYDAKRHTLQGPLLSTVLAACCRCAR